MRAAFFKRPGQPLRIEETPAPTPGQGQAVVKVRRCGICATDLSMTSGEGVAAYPLNTIIGHEISGEVIEVFAGAATLKVGDHVTGLAVQGGCTKCRACLEGNPHWCTGGGHLGNFGGYAQISMLQEAFALKLPATLSVDDGALVEPLACALHAVDLARLRPGARVLVIGAGPMGLGSTFWARRLGAGRIAVCARSTKGETMAMRLGADAFLSGSGEDKAALVNHALRGLPDVVIECSGSVGMFGEAMSLVRPRGTVVQLGFCTLQDSFYPAMGVGKEITVHFSMMYSLNDYQVVADVLDGGYVDPRIMITDIVGLDQLPEAFEALRSPHQHCKVMVDPWK